MHVHELNVDAAKARELWRKYREHRAWQQPHDVEIASIYKRIAQGRTVIRALASIRAAGLNDDGLPKLAIARADTPIVFLHVRDNSALFSAERSSWDAERRNASRTKNLSVDWPGFRASASRSRWTYEATVPLIPVHLRPRRGLANYHVLFEAEWARRYPVDPYLLRRIGGDAWLVVAAWDLTDVERAVMAARTATAA